MEAYVDDMLVKSTSGEKKIKARSPFETMNKVGMRLNPNKSFFCLSKIKSTYIYLMMWKGFEWNDKWFTAFYKFMEYLATDKSTFALYILCILGSKLQSGECWYEKKRPQEAVYLLYLISLYAETRYPPTSYFW